MGCSLGLWCLNNLMNETPEKIKYVFPIKKNGKIYRYMVRFIENGYRTYIGCFKTQEEAVIALNNYESKRKGKHNERPIQQRSI